jgi:aspartyl-tRNA(Asn)/glutamyl-tRNA(Gln) amidotransferase subunit C
MGLISREEVLRIARLAKLKLTDEEVELYREQLGRILEYFKKLEELDTADVEPMQHVLDVQNVLRPDEPRPSLSQEEALANAPKRRDGSFEVPQIIEKS